MPSTAPTYCVIGAGAAGLAEPAWGAGRAGDPARGTHSKCRSDSSWMRIGARG